MFHPRMYCLGHQFQTRCDDHVTTNIKKFTEKPCFIAHIFSLVLFRICG